MKKKEKEKRGKKEEEKGREKEKKRKKKKEGDGLYLKGAPDVGHAPTREARKIFGPFLVSRFRIENYSGVRRFDYFEKLRSMKTSYNRYLEKS
jgi:hypothetical protein